MHCSTLIVMAGLLIGGSPLFGQLVGPQDHWVLTKVIGEGKIGGEGNGLNDRQLREMAFDGDGRLFVLHSGITTAGVTYGPVTVFDVATGNVVMNWGARGTGAGQLNGDTHMTIDPGDGGHVLISDATGIKVFSLDGTYQKNLYAINNTNRIRDVAVDSAGNIFLIDYATGEVPIKMLDRQGNVLRQFGTRGQLIGQLNFDWDTGAVIPDYERQRIVVLDNRGNAYTVNVYDYSGTFLKYADMGFSPYSAISGGLSPDGVILDAGGNYIDQNLNVIRGTRANPFLAVGNGYLYGAFAFDRAGNLYERHCRAATGGGWVHGIGVYKRVYRTIPGPGAGQIPLPAVISATQRTGSAVVDLDYKVVDGDSATVAVYAAAFIRTSSALTVDRYIPMRSLVDGTAANTGTGVTTNTVHRLSWNVGADWTGDFTDLQVAVFAKDDRGLLDVQFVRIPAVNPNPELTVSRVVYTSEHFLPVWYWLLASGDTGVRADVVGNRILGVGGDYADKVLVNGQATTEDGASYLLGKMEYRKATPAEVTRIRSADRTNDAVVAPRVTVEGIPPTVNSYNIDMSSGGWYIVKP